MFFTTPIIILPIVFLFGITVGSFLNVCICRLPLGEDIVHTDSHCMSCGYQLAWYDLIPLFSWLLLRGRCRKCKAPVSIQYPAVELLNGLLWTGIIAVHGFEVTGICYCLAASSLLVLSVIDWRTYEIPIGCNYVILAVGIVNLFFYREDWLSFVIGAASVSGFLLFLLMVSGGRAMGGGDVKLMAAAGLLLGWKGILLAFVVGCIAGSVIHVGLMKIKGKERMLAFGPYLSFGIWFTMMWGRELIEWYTSLFRL